MTQKQVPSPAKIQAAQNKIFDVKSKLATLFGILSGSRKKLLALKSRLATPKLAQRYATLAKALIAYETSAKSHAKTYKVLTGTMNKVKGMFAAIAKGATATAGAIWDTAKKPVSWLMSKLPKKQQPGNIGDIESIDDLGIAAPVIWAAVTGTIVALSVAVGYLLNRASTLEEQIDALNDDIDDYEEKTSRRPQASAEDDFYYEDENEDWEEEY